MLCRDFILSVACLHVYFFLRNLLYLIVATGIEVIEGQKKPTAEAVG